MIAGSRTWAELAWLIIGFYWIGLTVLVVPVRLHRSPLHDAALFGLFPIAAALVLRFLDRPSRRSRPNPEAPAWTHRAAVGLLLTWPLAWIALILLGKACSETRSPPIFCRILGRSAVRLSSPC